MRVFRMMLVFVSVLAVASCATEEDEVTAEEAFPGRSGELRQGTVMTGLGEMELPYELIDGTAVFEGDIVLGSTKDDGEDVLKSASRSASAFRWTHGWVPYQIGSGFSQDERNEIETAVFLWDLLTLYDFRPRTTESAYVEFRKVSDGCSSPVGRQGNAQSVRISGGCSLGSVMHEIGHSLGLWHEQMRSDRDRYVSVRWDNIEDGKEGNFKTYAQRGLDGTDQFGFDFDSIMLYGSYFFSKNGLPTLVTRDGDTIDAQRSTLSDTDIGGANRFLTYIPGTTVLNNIKNARSGHCLDLSVDDRSRGVRLSQRTCDGSASQRWYVWGIPNASTSVIVNYWTGMCLAGDASASDPYRLRQLPCNRHGNMGIYLQYAAPPSTDRLLKIYAWNECAQVRTASTSSGAAVDKGACDGGADQRWRLERI